MAGLFDQWLGEASASPEEEERQRLAEAYKYAQLHPTEQLGFGMRQGQQLMESGAQRAIGGAFGLDVRSPGEKQRDATEAVRSKIRASGLAPGSKEYLTALMGFFNEEGMLSAAQAVQAALQKMGVDESVIAENKAQAEFNLAGAEARRRLDDKEQRLARIREMDERLATYGKDQAEWDVLEPNQQAERQNLTTARAEAQKRYLELYGDKKQETADWRTEHATSGDGQLWSREINQRTGQATEWKPVGGKKPAASGKDGGGRLSNTAVKEQNALLEEIGLARSVEADMGALVGKIDSRELDLGLLENLKSGVRNWAGRSTQNSREYATFMATLEKMRNDSLRLNKGVQTEGDSERAWKELFKHVNDKDVVKQRLTEIAALNARAARLRQLQLDQLRANYGAEPLEYTPDVASPLNRGDSGYTAAQEQWIARAMKANPRMSREAVVREGKKKGKL